LEGVKAFSGGQVARISSAANSIIAIGFSNLAGARNSILNQCSSLA
jgi:hypothetical protein